MHSTKRINRPYNKCSVYPTIDTVDLYIASKQTVFRNAYTSYMNEFKRMLNDSPLYIFTDIISQYLNLDHISKNMGSPDDGDYMIVHTLINDEVSRNLSSLDKTIIYSCPHDKRYNRILFIHHAIDIYKQSLEDQRLAIQSANTLWNEIEGKRLQCCASELFINRNLLKLECNSVREQLRCLKMVLNGTLIAMLLYDDKVTSRLCEKPIIRCYDYYNMTSTNAIVDDYHVNKNHDILSIYFTIDKFDNKTYRKISCEQFRSVY